MTPLVRQRHLVLLTCLCLTASSAACGGNADDDGGLDVDAGDSDTDGGVGSGADAMPAVDATPPFFGDPAEPGPYSVHAEDEVTATVDTVEAAITVCSPSDDGGATVAAGRFPAIVVSPGFQLPRTQYRSMCDHLASWGYVVLLQDYPRGGSIFNPPNHQTLAEDVGLLLDWALSPASGLAEHIDASLLAVAGHSLGGKVSILAAILDSRIKAVIGWDPVDANPPIGNGSPSVTPELMDGLTVPMALLGETLDSQGTFQSCAPAADNYQQYFDHACQAPEVLEVTVDGADHMDWIDDRGSCGFTCNVCQNGATEDSYTRELTRRVTVGFLEVQLRGREDLRPFLSAPELGSGTSVRQGPGC